MAMRKYLTVRVTLIGPFRGYVNRPAGLEKFYVTGHTWMKDVRWRWRA
jgi:hypothetical protein